mgnify:FL=1
MRLRRNANCIKERFGATAPAPTKGRLGGTMVAAPFYLWFVKELCHFSIKLGVVFILLHLAKGSFFFTCLRFLKGSALAQLMGSSFVLGMLAYEQSIL